MSKKGINLTVNPMKRDYSKILNNIISHIEQSKLKAFSGVNKALLHAYWSIGKELSENASYGKSIVEKLSEDLRLKYPNAKGYSIRNLWNMKKFYETYQKLQTLSAELLFSISWSNHISILDITQSEEVRFALAKTLSPVKVATYITRLPDKKLIIKRLEQFKIGDIKK